MSEAAEPYEGWAVVEEWRGVVGYEGVYEVSDFGRVRRIGRAARTGAGRGGGARVGRILKGSPGPDDGYVRVQLWMGGRNQTFLVHVLVATAFLGPTPEGQEVNHDDGVKSNNRLTNLEYLTRSQNNEHAYRTGLRSVTTRQAAALLPRRKARQTVACSCGCGIRIETPDRKGRDRRYASGHNARRSA